MSAIPKLQYNNTDSILEVRINNTQKPLKIDTTLECEALYYGYKPHSMGIYETPHL